MSKEYLEAFDILLQHIETEADWSDYEKVKNAHKIVEQALQRLESIDNANPSEALEYLERIRDILQNDRCIDIEWVFKHEYNTIKQALLKAQEQEKIIDTIKKHFIIKLEEETELNGNVWGRFVSIQAKEDEGDYDTTACANLVDYKEEFELLNRYLDE